MSHQGGDIRVQTMLNAPHQPVDPRWRVIGRTVRGASHIRNGLDNQDAIGWLPEDGFAPRVCLAVADGHGSPKNFRSAFGSRFAVDVSLAIASELLATPDQPMPGQPRLLSFVKDRLEQDVPRRVVRDWLMRVDEHLSRSPLSPDELGTLEARDGSASRELVAGNPRLAYGSTLVTAIAMESFMAFWQIGDGDVLTVSAAGKVSRPVPGDERLIANETTSLCSSDASRQFRVAVLGTPVPMVMVSTDGFSNSFQDDEGFFKFGSDVRELIGSDGLASVAGKLSDWLCEISERGSGDDISLGIICQPDVLNASSDQSDQQAGLYQGLPEERKPPDDENYAVGHHIAGDSQETLVLPAGDAPAGDVPAEDLPDQGLPVQPAKRSSWWWPPSWFRRWQLRRHRLTAEFSGAQPGGQASEI